MSTMAYLPLPGCQIDPAYARNATSKGRHKRLFDCALILLALPVLLPIYTIIFYLVRATSTGPAFFIQTRVGRDGVPFGMIKFRSMQINAEALLPQILVDNDRDGLCFKAKDDPRITRFGRFLRRSSLDELPQLINVLKGEMSLVGPRPAIPQEVAAYPVAARERLSVLPGITGAWQVAGRADLGFDAMISLDIAYARAPLFRTDVVILWKTVAAVISGRGAY